MRESDCFLCAPDSALVIQLLKSTYSMVGLGPISPTYAMLAAKRHSRSLADLYREQPLAIAELEQLRSSLESVRGPLIMTEHGRVPVCRDDGDDHEQHCFHAHALTFSLEKDISDIISRYYRDDVQFSDIRTALDYAYTQETYMLISSSAQEYRIFSDALNTPRQLARTIAAISCGEDEKADWRSSPRHEESLIRAAALRSQLEPLHDPV